MHAPTYLLTQLPPTLLTQVCALRGRLLDRAARRAQGARLCAHHTDRNRRRHLRTGKRVSARAACEIERPTLCSLLFCVSLRLYV